jgi:hypothetical protein
VGIKNNNQPSKVYSLGVGGHGGGRRSRTQDVADDNRDNNVTARDGTVDATREEEEEDFSKSSKGTARRAPSRIICPLMQ